MAPLALLLSLLSVPAHADDDEIYFDTVEAPYGHARVDERVAKPTKPSANPDWPAEIPKGPPIACDLQVYVGRHGENLVVRVEQCPEPFREYARAHAASYAHEPVRLGGGIKPVWYPTIVRFQWSSATRPAPPSDSGTVARPGTSDAPRKVRPGEAIIHEDEVKVLQRTEPSFPKEARSQGIVEVACEVRIHADKDGDVGDIEFVRCPPAFEEPILGAIAQWQHGKVTVAGKATAFTYTTVVRLRDESEE